MVPRPTPRRKLTINSQRHPKTDQDIFVGFACALGPIKDGDPSKPRDLEWTIVLHDATGVIETETFTDEFTVHEDEEQAAEDVRKFTKNCLSLLRELQSNKHMNVRIVALAEPIPEELRGKKNVEFYASVWLHMDAIPFLVVPSTALFKRLPSPSTQANAQAAVATAVKYLHPASHSATLATTDPKDHSVQVDCDGQVKLCSILQYEQSTSPELWARFMALSNHLNANKTSIAFFSATPQGGGVALMRHALIRLWRMVGLNVKWYTPEGHPTVFDITKRKIHNVLQGVAPEGMEISDKDKEWFELWTERNYEVFWQNGAIDADLIVIDDPQLTALIPIIKKHRPDAKIIFRSHIQIQSDLTDDPSTAQHRTWNYLFNFIKDVDLFLAHPVKFFVPKNVHDKLPVLYMAPSTDPIDGLNKPYGHASLRYYRQHFNAHSENQCGVTIDWDRGYICQIARFDPSKGTDVLLRAYLDFRKKLKHVKNPPADGGPQLIIMGHGSIDDPDGQTISDKLHEILNSEEYKLVKEDVSIVRAPPSDSLLGCILQGAWVATQLSTREGFEVKVTEAIHKRVPIIASDAGGIPLQVKHGKNGWIVPAGDADAVSKLLIDIYEGKEKVHRDLSGHRKLDGKSDPNSVAQSWVGGYDTPVIKVHDDKHSTSEDFWTVGNATRWMLLASRVLGLPNEPKGDLQQQDVDLLQSMEIGKKLEGSGVDGMNVWKMVMGEDMIEGEGELI